MQDKTFRAEGGFSGSVNHLLLLWGSGVKTPVPCIACTALATVSAIESISFSTSWTVTQLSDSIWPQWEINTAPLSNDCSANGRFKYSSQSFSSLWQRKYRRAFFAKNLEVKFWVLKFQDKCELIIKNDIIRQVLTVQFYILFEPVHLLYNK